MFERLPSSETGIPAVKRKELMQVWVQERLGVIREIVEAPRTRNTPQDASELLVYLSLLDQISRKPTSGPGGCPVKLE